jgi:hypothetical protein
MTTRAVQPAADLILVLGDGGGNRHLGCGAICVSRIRRNGFVLQTLMQFRIAFAHVTLKRVSSASFIAREIVTISRGEGNVRDRLRRWWRRLGPVAVDNYDGNAQQQNADPNPDLTLLHGVYFTYDDCCLTFSTRSR